MTDLPEPLVPSEVDLREFSYMPLYTDRLMRSRTWLRCKRRPELAFYLINLWGASWHELPSASLPDDDDQLADFARCDPHKWDDIKQSVMTESGWILCSDGRWYHPVVAEIALQSWAGCKTKEQKRAADRERKRLRKGAAIGIPSSSARVPMEFHSVPRDRPGIPAENALKGREERIEEGSVDSYESTAAAAAPWPSVFPGTQPRAKPPPPDPKKEIYARSKVVLGKNAGGQITKLIRLHEGDLEAARYTLEQAAKAAFPAEYIGKILSGESSAPTNWDAEYEKMGIRPDGSSIGYEKIIPLKDRPGDDGGGWTYTPPDSSAYDA